MDCIKQVFEYPEYPVQLVVGTAGASLTENRNVDNPPAFGELVLYEFGYGRLIAHNASHLSFEFVSSLNGTVLDKMMIIQVKILGLTLFHSVYLRCFLLRLLLPFPPTESKANSDMCAHSFTPWTTQDPAAIGCATYPNVTEGDGGSKLSNYCESGKESQGQKSTNSAKIAVAVIVLVLCVAAASFAVFVRLRQAKKERYCRVSTKEVYGNLELAESMDLVAAEVVPTYSKNGMVDSEVGLETIDEKDVERDVEP